MTAATKWNMSTRSTLSTLLAVSLCSCAIAGDDALDLPPAEKADEVSDKSLQELLRKLDDVTVTPDAPHRGVTTFDGEHVWADLVWVEPPAGVCSYLDIWIPGGENTSEHTASGFYVFFWDDDGVHLLRPGVQLPDGVSEVDWRSGSRFATGIYFDEAERGFDRLAVFPAPVLFPHATGVYGSTGYEVRFFWVCDGGQAPGA